MLFGLKNVPGTLQPAMDVILYTVRCQFSLLYLDNIVVIFRTSIEHIDRVQQLLTILLDADVTPKLKKCDLFKTFTNYLGHVIQQVVWRCSRTALTRFVIF